ncbi:hypothetical protein EYC59_04370 [Candidatus Saccharibacteria bacterium]|nr:MAG: hypothetical protein EYC59_04370 [Candidatus Saccharibacteria bacterium]
MVIFSKNPSLLWRIFYFIVAFVLISSVLGPRIINHNLVGQFGFGAYGGAGKALVFALLAFAILTHRTFRNLKAEPWSWREGLAVLGGGIGFVVAWTAISRLQAGAGGFWWPLLAHLGLIVTVACVFFAIVGLSTASVIWRRYRREVLLAIGIGAGFFVFLEAVYAMWSVLATMVLHATYGLLKLFGFSAGTAPPYILVLDDFAVEISKYCSGIESIALFTGIYAIVGLLDWKRFDHRKYLLAFLPGILLLQICNILRIFILMLVGHYISPDMAFKLFHTYAGMIFFVIATGFFWLLTYKWMLRSKQAKAQ